MSEFVKINLEDVTDVAPDFGLAEVGETRMARRALGCDRIGMAHYRMHPGKRMGFGHAHTVSEEIYLVVAGSGRFQLGDATVEVGPRDVVYVPPTTMREWQAGDDGMEVVAFGGHVDDEDSRMEPDFWAE